MFLILILAKPQNINNKLPPFLRVKAAQTRKFKMNLALYLYACVVLKFWNFRIRDLYTDHNWVKNIKTLCSSVMQTNKVNKKFTLSQQYPRFSLSRFLFSFFIVGWTVWSLWTNCTTANQVNGCYSGTQSRQRKCKYPTKMPCFGIFEESRDCPIDNCKCMI